MMKRTAAMLLVLLLLAGAAYADQAVKLEGTRFTLALPDEMEYDGPGKPGKADFAYVSGSLGLEILFTSADGSGLSQLTDIIPFLEDDVDEVSPVTVNGIEMLKYRISAHNPEGKAIGYILRDGNKVWQVEFWYASQTAADLTKTIMESIQ